MLILNYSAGQNGSPCIDPPRSCSSLVHLAVNFEVCPGSNLALPASQPLHTSDWEHCPLQHNELPTAVKVTRLSVVLANAYQFLDQELFLFLGWRCSKSLRLCHFKSDWNVLQVNTHQLTESDFQFDVTLSRWWPWRHFTLTSAAILSVHVQRLPRTRLSMCSPLAILCTVPDP